MSINPITQVTEQQLNDFCKGKNIVIQTIPEYFKNIIDLSKFDFSKPLDYITIVKIFDHITRTTGEVDWLNVKDDLVELDGIYYLLCIAPSYNKCSPDTTKNFNKLSFEDKLKFLSELVLKHLNQEKLDKISKEIQNLIDSAEEFANKTKTRLQLNVDYGISGTYYESAQEWESSSQSC